MWIKRVERKEQGGKRVRQKLTVYFNIITRHENLHNGYSSRITLYINLG